MLNEIAKIILAATHAKLSKVTDAYAVEGTINALKCEFQFRTPDWDNTNKTAVFVRGRATPSTINEKPICVILDENNECDVPSEILVKEGVFSVGVFGTKDNYRIVSNWICYKIDNGCYADGSTPIDPSSTIYEQIISMLNNKSDVSHNHDDRYYTKEEAEDRFLSEDELVQPDWQQPYMDMPGFIKNRTHYEYKNEDFSSDILEEPTVGLHLIKDFSGMSQSMLSYYYSTYSLNTFNITYYYKLCFYGKAFSKWQDLERGLWVKNNNVQSIDAANSKMDVNAKKGIYMYVIIDRSLLSDEDAIKFPKHGIYIEVTDATASDFIKNISLVQMSLKRLDKRYLPNDTIYLSDLENVIDGAELNAMLEEVLV